MCPKQPLNIWPPKRRRMLMRSPVALPKMALSTNEGQDYHGCGSIRPWKQAADAKYRYVLQTVNVQTLGVSGDGACPTRR
jgi:hypothetical protein